jgi:hypothetical protein
MIVIGYGCIRREFGSGAAESASLYGYCMKLTLAEPLSPPLI